MAVLCLVLTVVFGWLCWLFAGTLETCWVEAGKGGLLGLFSRMFCFVAFVGFAAATLVCALGFAFGLGKLAG